MLCISLIVPSFFFLKISRFFQILYTKAPTLLHLKSFGCLTYASTIQAYRTKCDTRVKKTIFLGYRNDTKGFLLYDLHMIL